MSPHKRGPTPDTPAQSLVESLAARAQGSELPIAGIYEITDCSHDLRAQAPALASRVGGDSLYVCGPQRHAFDVDLARNNRSVADDGAVRLEDEVCPSQGVVPVFLGEATVLIAREGVVHELPQARHLGV